MRVKINFLVFVIASCLLSCSQNNNAAEKKDTADTAKLTIVKQNSTDEYLITDTSIGKINKETTYKDLQGLFGNNLQDTIDYGPEGADSFTVTKLYPNTSRELTIQWQPDKLHMHISSIECYNENSPYHTADSLKAGSTLETLLKINGQKISFYGTGWDYGGIITSYNNGKFKKSNIYFQLATKEGASEKVMGDRELNTDMPVVKANLQKIYISKVSVSF